MHRFFSGPQNILQDKIILSDKSQIHHLKNVLRLKSKDRVIVFDDIRNILNKSKPNNILILVGPEGDFAPDEIDLAKQAGCIPISLGDLVLRVETATVAVVSFIRLYVNS